MVFDTMKLKVILETGLLTDDEKVRVCEMRRTVGPALGVKASGGVRDRATALAMLEAGATRLGTRSGVAIVTDKDGSDAAY